jgi:hypothetical protein
MITDNRTPKQRFAEFNSLNSASLFGYTYDPIAEELRAPEKFASMLRGHPVVPFAKNGEVTIPFINKLCRLSPTNGSIINRKLEFTLGGQWTVQRRKAESWAIDEDELPEVTVEEKEGFKEWVKATFGEYNALEKAARPCLNNYLRFANAFIELKLYKTAGEWYGRIFNHDVDKCLYLPTPPGIPRVVQVWPFWYSLESENSEPVKIPVYPGFSENEDGSISTIFHLKNDVPGRDWYGEPEFLNSLYYIYNEIQLGEYTVNGYSNDWLPRVFLETYEGFGNEGPPVNEEEDSSGNVIAEGPEGFRNNMDAFFTRKGTTRSRWLHRNAPEGSQPSAIHEFNPSQDYKGHKSDSELAMTKIIISHDWHSDLMVSTPGRLGGGGVFRDAFQSKYYTVIKPLEDLVVDTFNKILRVVDQYQGGTNTESLSAGLENLYAFMLYDTATAEEEALDNAGEAAATITEAPITREEEKTE